MRTSMRQIAARANVSPMTVSRVLRGRKGQASPETVERILAASRELSYIPVHSTMQNKQRKKHIIGVVFEGAGPNRFFNPLDIKVYESMCRAAAQHGYDLLNLLRDDSDWVLGSEELRYLDRRSDGLIFISSKMQQRQAVLEVLANHSIPTVVFGRRDVPEGIAWVDVNNESTVSLSVDYLVARGHKHIAFLGGPDERFDRQQRRLTFNRAMKANGLAASSTTVADGIRPDFSLDESQAARILETRATAVLCVNDHAACQFWDFAAQRGVKVGQDISLMGVDDIHEAAWRGLTTVDTTLSRAGQVAVDAWISLLEGKSPATCCQELPVNIVERSSVVTL